MSGVAPKAPPSRRRRWLFLLFSFSPCLLVLLWYVPKWWRGPPPPDVARTHLDAEVAKAIDDARAAVEHSPRSAAAWGKLGMVFQAHELYAEARLCYDRAESLDLRSARWPYLRGLTLLATDREAAVEQFRRAAQRDPGEPVIQNRLAEMLLAQGQFDEAEKYFQGVLKRNPRDPRAHLGLARVASSRRDWERSLEYLRQAATLAPNVKAMHSLAAEIQARLGNQAAADKASRRAAELGDFAWPDPYLDEIEPLQTGVEARIHRALRLNRDRRSWDEAVRLAADTAQTYPDYYRAWVAWGMILLLQEAPAAAERPLREALRLRPDGVDAHNTLATSFVWQKKFAEAAACYRDLIALNPRHADAHHQLAICLSHLGEAAEAIEMLRAAVRCKPDFAEAHRDLADLLARSGRRAEAGRHAQDAVKLAPADPRAKKLLERLSSDPGGEHHRTTAETNK